MRASGAAPVGRSKCRLVTHQASARTFTYDGNISPATVITVLHDTRFAGKTALKRVARLLLRPECVCRSGECRCAGIGFEVQP